MNKNLEDVFTIEREVNFSTGANYFLCRMTGGLILLGEDVIPAASGLIGAPGKKVFTFKCVFPGPASIQFAISQVPGAPLLYEQILPFEIEKVEEANEKGGWTDQHPLSEEEKNVFDEALEDWCGVGYEPLSVASQVVNGMNYRYICKATTVTNPPQISYAMVCIYKPFEGKGMIIRIIPFLKD